LPRRTTGRNRTPLTVVMRPMTTVRRSHIATALLVALLASSCAPVAAPQPSSSPDPTPSASPSPSASPPPARATVDSEAEAAARVLASDPRFAGIGPILPDIIGQSAWYEAVATGDGYEVTIIIGWDDCFAGCISKHRWSHDVTTDGAVTLTSEEGDGLPSDLPPPPDVTGEGALDITLVAGPVCPVETQPADPACEPRPVANATVVIRSADGSEIARTVSDDQGHARADGLPAGVYVVEAEPVQGYMGTPPAAAVWALGAEPGAATLAYDTGIR
jgi:hypothetical protein